MVTATDLERLANRLRQTAEDVAAIAADLRDHRQQFNVTLQAAAIRGHAADAEWLAGRARNETE